MHYNIKAVPDTLLGKNCFKKCFDWATHEAKGDQLKKENEIKNRSLHFAAYIQSVWWIYRRLGKEDTRVLPSCTLWKIRHYPGANGKYDLYNESEKD